MRIITGNAKGRRLKTPDTQDIRPTADRVREAVFSMINFELHGSRVLDLFAGTGSLGLEAISRGAQYAVFVDNNRQAVNVIKDNIELLGFADKARVLYLDAFKAMEMLGCSRERFDIIFIDPPYKQNLYNSIVLKLIEQDLVDRFGIIIIEHPSGVSIEGTIKGLYTKKNKRYGSTRITVMMREENNENSSVPRKL